MLRFITNEQLQEFKEYLKNEERESSTIAKYLHDVQVFVGWLGEKEITKEKLTGYKEYLIEKKYNPKTINGILSAINKFLTFVGQSELKVKYLRIQRQLFRNSNRELTQAEYLKFQSWYLEYPIKDEELVDSEIFSAKAAEVFRIMNPFNDYLNKALADFQMPAR